MNCPKCKTGRIVADSEGDYCLNCGYIVPGSEGKPGNGVAPVIESKEALGTQCLAKARESIERARKLDVAAAKARDDAKDFVAIAELCRVTVPDEVLAGIGRKAKTAKATVRSDAKATDGRWEYIDGSTNRWRCRACGTETVTRWRAQHESQCRGEAVPA